MGRTKTVIVIKANTKDMSIIMDGQKLDDAKAGRIWDVIGRPATPAPAPIEAPKQE